MSPKRSHEGFDALVNGPSPPSGPCRAGQGLRRCALATAAATLIPAVLALANPATAEVLCGPDIIDPPDSVEGKPDGHQNLNQQAFDEQQLVELPRDVEIDPGGVFLPAGTFVNSHMIFLQPPDGTNVDDFDQVWIFDGLILGVMSDQGGTLEAATSDILGATGTTYPDAYNYRGLEASIGPDGYVVSGNSITVNMRATVYGDFIRVVTAPPDGCSDPLLYSTLELSVGAGPRDVATGDFDLDGNQDVVTPNFSDGTVSVRLGNGDGTFDADHAYSAGTGPNAVAVGDVDGDDYPDLAVTNANIDQVVVLLNDGAGAFAIDASYATGMGPSAVALGDVDNDDDLDMVVANGDSNDVSVRLNNGHGTFGAQTLYSSGLNADVALSDLNGDDYLDIALVNDNADLAIVLLNNADGTFGSASPYGVGGNPQAVVAGDVNHDCYPDLVSANYVTDDLSVLINNGDGTFATHVPYDVGEQGVHDVAIADLDGDGDLDLVAIASLFDEVASILLNNGDGTFTLFAMYDVSTAYGAVATAEFNGDSIVDIVIAKFADDLLTFLLSGGGTAGILPSDVLYAAGDGPSSVITADLDGEGSLDLAVANWIGNDVTVLVNDGAGGFSTHTTCAVGDSPSSLEVGDLDNDHDLDLAAVTYWDDSLSILLNNGDGTFAPQVVYSVGRWPTCVALADVDGDGDLDAAVTNSLDDTVSILLNNGSGAFALDADYETGEQPSAVVAGDFDDDGDRDLAVANDVSSGSVSVLLNNGDGTFAPHIVYSAGAFPDDLAAADLDGDCDLDLAVLSLTDDEVSILLGDGTGAFGAPDPYATGDGPWAVEISDLNCDGHLDVAVAYEPLSGESGLSVLFGYGDGTFEDFVAYETDGDGPVALDIGDFDRDGDADVILANNGSNDVSVLFNYCKVLLPLPCPADFNGDGQVGTWDLLYLLSCWGEPCGDLDGDCDTGTVDLLLLLAAWGPCP